MKKLIFSTLSLLLVVSLVSGCGCAKKTDNSYDAAPSAEVPAANDAKSTDAEEPAENKDTQEAEPDTKRPAVSENKEVVKAANAPKVLMIQNSDSNMDNITYHLESCALLEGKDAQEVSWELIQMVGFWQCPECNPPRYEDYKNAE